jgi:alpha-amylase
MKAICFYFQVHQPFRLKTYRFFDIGVNHNYFDEYANRYILRRVADKCYIPANNVILNLIKEFGSSFKVSYSISGTALDQFEMYTPDVLESFQRLAETGCVEFLAETYSHSLSSLRSKDEFFRQVGEQSKKIERLFGQKPTTFRNTELIYSDGIGEMVAEMGFNTMLTEGAKHVLGWKSPNYMYCNSINPKLKLLLKNFRLSDDIAFRFSQTSWNEWPVTTEKYVDWLNNIDEREECVNLFMDYETFGEHQWPETGIFEFLKALPGRVFSNSPFKFHTPSELSKILQPVSPIYVQYPISWADEERDLTAWLGNDLQDDAFHRLYDLKEKVYCCHDESIMRDWRYLQTSDHFYYMCTKWFSDGDVHKYFNPYNTPYEAFINFMNILSDFLIRIHEICPETRAIPIATEENKGVMAMIDEIKKEVFQEKKAMPTLPRRQAGGRQASAEKPAEKKNTIKKTVGKKPKPAVISKTSKKPTKRNAVKVRGNEMKLLASIAKPALKQIFRDYDLKILAMALVSTDDELTDKVRSSIGQSSGRKLRTAMKKITSPKSKEVKEARRKIEEQIKKYFASLKK